MKALSNVPIWLHDACLSQKKYSCPICMGRSSSHMVCLWNSILMLTAGPANPWVGVHAELLL